MSSELQTEGRRLPIRATGQILANAVARAGRHWLALLFFAGTALLLTWPLVLHLGDAAPSKPGESTQDLWEKLWDLWWFSEALWRGVDPFHTDMLFYPKGASLLFHPLSPASALLAIPIQALAGPLAAYNTLVLLSFILGGYAVFLLAQRHGCGFSAALAGGLVYSAAAFHFNHIHLSHLELISIQWLPLYALALDVLLNPIADHRSPHTDASDSSSLIAHRSSFVGRRSSVVRVLLTALAMLMLIFTSLYLALYAALLSGIWMLWLIGAALRRRSARNLLRPAAELGLATALALAVAGPILLAPMLSEMRQSSYMLQNFDLAASRAAGAADILLPQASHPLRRVLALPEPLTGGSFLGFVPLALAIYGAATRLRVAARWIVLGTLAWLISLGPALPLYELIFSLPLLQISRYPDRFAVLTLLSVSVIAALGADRLLQRLSGDTSRSVAEERTRESERRQQSLWRLAIGATALIGLLFLELYPGPSPLVRPADQPLYHSLAADRSSDSVLELPISRINREWIDMYAQTLHKHPILDGALARPVPSIPIEWMPLIRSLEQPDAPADITGDSPSTRPAALRFLNLGYLIYHRTAGTKAVTPPSAEALTRATGVPVAEIYADAELVAYRLSPPEIAGRIEPFVGLGFDWDGLEGDSNHRWRWLNKGSGTVWLYTPADGPLTLRLTSRAYHQPRRLTIYLDEQAVAEVDVGVQLTETSMPLDLRAGQHTIRLVATEPGISPQALGQGNDVRLLTVAVYAIALESGNGSR